MSRGEALVRRAKKESSKQRVVKPKSLDEVRKSKLVKIQQALENLGVENLVVPPPESDDVMEDYAYDGAERLKFLNDEGAGMKATNRAFGHHLRSAIAMADVVVEVLDARDPQGYRSKALEEAVLEQGKKLVLLLNKIDLHPDMAVVERWEKHFKVQAPVVLFRAMTTTSRSKCSTVKFEKGKVTAASRKQLNSGYSPLGAADLMGLLTNYTRVEASPAGASPAKSSLEENEEDNFTTQKGEKDAGQSVAPVSHKNITVCIVGMPNVGKSSVINSLLRNSRCLKTGNQPGVTREAQTVKLTARIKLVDTPGLVLDSDSAPIDQLLRGTLKDKSDVLSHAAIEHLLTNPAKRRAINAYFGFADDAMSEETVEQFLARVCDARKLVLSGGRRNLVGAMQTIINAWTNGLVQYYTIPKVQATQCEIVATPSKELDLNNL